MLLIVIDLLKPSVLQSNLLEIVFWIYETFGNQLGIRSDISKLMKELMTVLIRTFLLQIFPELAIYSIT